MSLLEEYNGPAPAPVKLQMVRGDTFQRKLFQAAEYIDPADTAQGTRPVDVRDLEFLFEVRETAFDSDTEIPLITAGMEYVTFGQSQDAIDYDAAQGNPAETTYDEVHIELPASMTKIDPSTWQWGLRIIYPTGLVELAMQDKIKVWADVPRYSEEP